MTDAIAMPAPPRKLGLLRAVTIIALVTLPFMTALTINIGFPLKIYEVALLVAMVLVPFSGRLSFPSRARSGVALTVTWIGLAGLILLIRLVFPLNTVETAGLAGRFGPIGDGGTKFIYLLLDLFAFILFARFAAKDEKTFLKYWLIGAVIAATYSFYLFGMNMFGIVKPPLLPGGGSVQMLFIGRLFIRCATFREGNEAGLYFAISALLAFHGKHYKAAWYLLGAIITTFSTLALIVLSAVLAWHFWRFIQTLPLRARILLMPLTLALGIGAGATIAATALFQNVVVSKLTSESGPDAFSRLERLVFAKAAWDMFTDHPWLGVGAAQFGYNFRSYSDYPVSGKPIPNIIYLEFLSEDGIIVLFLFIVFFYLAFRKTAGENATYLRFAIASLTLGFFAYSTISVMFIWALFGLIFGRHASANVPRLSEDKRTA